LHISSGAGILEVRLAVRICVAKTAAVAGMGSTNFPRLHHATNGANIMMRKVMMALAAVAVVTIGAGSTASAFHGGFGGGHFGGGRFGGGHPGGAGAFHGHFSGGHFGHGRFDHDRFRHRFGNRFFFYGDVYPYGYYTDDGCYTRVWTRWGWNWQYVCY
jgi:hypothetical protein